MTQVTPGKTERPPKSRDDREPSTGGVIQLEQGRLFFQLFTDEEDSAGFGSSLHTPARDRLMIEALAEQLVPRLNGVTQWPLQAVFHLPGMGRIKISAQHEIGAWSLDLEAEEERTRLWLGSVRQRCEERLGRELGGSVSLFLRVPGIL
jgi:hypothetical protein